MNTVQTRTLFLSLVVDDEQGRGCLLYLCMCQARTGVNPADFERSNLNRVRVERGYMTQHMCICYVQQP